MELEKYICVMMGQEADALKRLLAMDAKKCDKAWVMGCIMKRLDHFYKDYIMNV
jgi:hypothetical protein